MTSQEIRKAFLDFFESKQHKIVPSAPIVVKNDPTLMFTNAGMNQFKDIFLGNKTVEYSRVADTQKCLRVSGKHNDLEEVGVDTYHHTMFEMLGNWSFGDYFKKESISWGWELLTKVYKLDTSRLYVTVFEGDAAENLAFDQEAYDAWKTCIAEERILRGNKKDNFWEMGDTGPCGPCSEIHYDMRSDAERKIIDGKTLVNTSDPQVIEIWNHVFIQFNRKADGTLEELPSKHVDTGMGFERLVRALQSKASNYDTDIFTPLINKIETLCGKNYGKDEKIDIAFRVIADHIRAVSFCIADGQLPSNTGAGYVIRRILRRAIRYGFSFLGLKKPFFHALVDVLAEEFKNVFPEVFAQKELVSKVILEEETSFLKTLGSGLKMIDEYIEKFETTNTSKWEKFFTGSFVFMLSDTYGFPSDLTNLIAKEKGYEIDWEKFNFFLQEQKLRSKVAADIGSDDWVVLKTYSHLEFKGYETLETTAHIVKYKKEKVKEKVYYKIVFNETPFYGESGGQIGDTGFFGTIDEEHYIYDTKKENDLTVHFSETIPTDVKKNFNLRVDAYKRKETQGNHTATHILHAALRNILGTHVQQKGSYVGPDRLRFDFSHFSKVSDAEIQKIETLINEKIRENITVQTKVMPIEDAKKLGAMMLFGEKYGDSVRVVIADENFSKEFCGGTHVQATGQIGLCKIVAEGAVAAGIRRIEAVTGTGADNYVLEQVSTVDQIKELVKSHGDVVKNVQALISENDVLKKEVEKFQLIQLGQLRTELKNKIEKIGVVNFISSEVPLSNTDLIKKLAYDLRNETENLFCVLGSAINGKANLTVIIADNLVKEKNLDAVKIIKELGKEIDGGGGGQPFFATAGGKNISGIVGALEKSKVYLQNLSD